MADKNNPKLESISILRIEGAMSLRIDWDNDRHQCVPISENNSKGLINAMAKMTALLHQERQECEI